MKPHGDDAFALAALVRALERHEKSLATIESRVALMHEEVRRIAETAARLRLALDNVKRLSLAQGEALTRIERRLAGAWPPRR
ncbi:hypothetical protein [Amphiplicatus metriothermophilus]|uniref:Uncharacterized protein n=1 Tax=Amphiplicatus metriothermophilus TaxID=1519374 RepID=A0A239PXJ9_9PROT|nr:hypothetical protein [Amphiplicatus metriothermophilus]MBB5519065.1 hypothetical protein [Amphiplicatus metriothermophilus]SNT74753.1 hypothetical protein SAMN06297382_2343 [Amphiplicatus metriothermophilus]